MKDIILVQGFLFEIITYNIVSGQPSSVGDNVDSYEIRIHKLVRRIDLLESDVNQYFNKWFVFVAISACILNVIPKHVKPVLNISTKI